MWGVDGWNEGSLFLSLSALLSQAVLRGKNSKLTSFLIVCHTHTHINTHTPKTPPTSTPFFSPESTR